MLELMSLIKESMVWRREIMTEGKVAWNDYCPRCEKSTPQNFGFGKMRLCGNCLKVIDDHEQEMIKQNKGGYY